MLLINFHWQMPTAIQHHRVCVAACLSFFKCLPGPDSSILPRTWEDVEMPSLSGIGASRPIAVTTILSCPLQDVEIAHLELHQRSGT